MNEVDQKIIGLLDRKKVFVGGITKSGTTWMQLLLNSHPNIICRGEGHLLNMLGEKFMRAVTEYNMYIVNRNTKVFNEIDGFPTIAADDRKQMLRFILSTLFAKYEGVEHAEVIGEKTPDNVFKLEALHDIFPESKFLIMVRDPRDIVCSAIHHAFRVNEIPVDDEQGQMRCAKAISKQWLEGIRSAEKFSKRHEHLLLQVKYEELLSAPEVEIKKIFEFLDVNSDTQLVQQCADKSSFKAVSGGRDLGTASSDSHFRKGGSGGWRDDLQQAPLDFLMSKLGGAMEKMGYEV